MHINKEIANMVGRIYNREEVGSSILLESMENPYLKKTTYTMPVWYIFKGFIIQ